MQRRSTAAGLSPRAAQLPPDRAEYYGHICSLVCEYRNTSEDNRRLLAASSVRRRVSVRHRAGTRCRCRRRSSLCEAPRRQFIETKPRSKLVHRPKLAPRDRQVDARAGAGGGMGRPRRHGLAARTSARAVLYDRPTSQPPRRSRLCSVCSPTARGARSPSSTSPKTVAAQIPASASLSRRLLVGDRGMLTAAPARTWPPSGWITALRGPAIRTLVTSGALQLSVTMNRTWARSRTRTIRVSGSSSARTRCWPMNALESEGSYSTPPRSSSRRSTPRHSAPTGHCAAGTRSGYAWARS